MWVNVALVLVAVAWLIIAGGVGCAIGRAVRIADTRSAPCVGDPRRVAPTPERG